MTRQWLCIVVAVVAACPIASASEPGEPITSNDTVALLPGLRAAPFLERIDPVACQDEDSLQFLLCARSFPTSRQDAEGSVYAARQRTDRSELWRTRRDGSVELVAQIPLSRPAPGGCFDVATFHGFYLEPVNGEIYVRLASGCAGSYACCMYSDGIEVFRIKGLRPLAKVIRRHHDLELETSEPSR